VQKTETLYQHVIVLLDIMKLIKSANNVITNVKNAMRMEIAQNVLKIVIDYQHQIVNALIRHMMMVRTQNVKYVQTIAFHA